MTKSATLIPEERPVCSACGQVNGLHLDQCKVGQLERELATARQEIARKEQELEDSADGLLNLRQRLAEALKLLADFALGYDTLNEPDTCLNWAEVEALVKQTRLFLTKNVAIAKGKP